MIKTPIWQQFLSATQLQISTEQPCKKLSIHPLDYQSLIQIKGPDSEDFLQGQLSCDMREVVEEGSRLAAHCNPKGSMISLMRALKAEDCFCLRLNNQNIDTALSTLNKYIMFSKAQALDMQDQWLGFGVQGSDAAAMLQRHFLQPPTSTNQVSSSADKLLVKVPGERYELWLKPEQAKKWLEDKGMQASLSSSDYWLQQEILSAIPDIYPQSSTSYLPQMCNLQALDGVSFKKGCYTGQEIITRLHFRGKLNKYLLTARLSSANVDNSIIIGSDIDCAQRAKIAKVLQHVTVGSETFVQLVINVKYAAEPLFTEAGLALETLPSPYELDPSLFVRKD
ncbi:MAG: hypothetical protein OFPI_13020 [Osedax symbiont Rs2]|nr:MAG: hypothetical protein OFPI_13020 [Osedax symbiont Rs2]